MGQSCLGGGFPLGERRLLVAFEEDDAIGDAPGNRQGETLLLSIGGAEPGPGPLPEDFGYIP